MSKPNLGAIRARWPVDGEWWFRDGATVKTLVDGGEEVTVAQCVGESESALKDAEFISHAFRDIYHLLAYVEQLESDLDAAAYRAGVTQGRIGQLQTQIEQLENLLDEVRALVGSDNESGMISASAIFHTIGTINQGGRQ